MALSNNEYLGAAENLVDRFRDEEERLRSAALDERVPDPRILWDQLALLDAIDSDETIYSDYHLADFGGARLDRLADNLIAGRPLEVYALETVASIYAQNGPEAGAETSGTTAQLIGLLGSVATGNQPMAVTTIVDRPINSPMHKDHNAAVQDRVREQVLETGRIVFREPEEPQDLLGQLERSERGKLVYKRGRAWFEPEPQLLESVKHPQAPVNLVKDFFVRSDMGEFSEAAVLAGALESRSTAKVVLADSFDKSGEILRGANALLLAARPNPSPLEHHVIRHNPNRLPPSTAAYALARLLRSKVQECARVSENLRDSATEPGWTGPYLRRNYGEEVKDKSAWDILPDDLDLIQFLVDELPLHIAPRSLRSYRNIGRGPYSYLDSLFEPFLTPGAHMRLQEPSEEARKLSEDWKHGRLAPEFVGIGSKYESFMMAAGGIAHGHLWRGSDERARRAAIIEPGKLSNLEGEHDIEAEAFVSCSTASMLPEFQRSICARAEASRQYVVGLHMLGTKKWDKFASVQLTEADVLDTYSRVANLEVLGHVATSNEIKARAGYTAMMGIVARKRR